MTQPESALPGLPTEAPRPDRADTPAEFTAALRELRTWTGLTYRELESKATAQADPLPASTIATTLSRVTLPRERFVGAFVRACGLGEDETRQWILAHRRIATEGPAPTRGEGGARTGGRENFSATGVIGPTPAPRWWRRAAALACGAGLGAVGTLAVVGLRGDTGTGASPSPMPVTGLRMLAVGSWAQLHPARTPELCVTEGKDRTGGYETAVAVQRPCTQEGLPQVFLEPTGRNTVQIQWHHPDHGIGCLTVLRDGPGRDLVEPRDDCTGTDPAQQFRIEPFGPPAAAHFRVRPVSTGRCLSLRDQNTIVGAEVVQGRCSGAPDQDFLIELTRPPRTATGPGTAP
ncbi:helix-turn-helix domain-containing protein [Streptomyces sp. NPDC056568]|uniref:helix-turn-helix domain-containing protein n=1 Tax=Streptomyces sp. NPDC056568 TaxID=3345866 RepID=UPI0036A5AE59